MTEQSFIEEQSTIKMMKVSDSYTSLSTDMDYNVSSSPDITLQELNDQYAKDKIGGMVFIGIMMIIGVIGNAHVLYLYAFKFPKTTHRIYILWLALLDMITCSVGMPFVIVDLRNPLMFNQIWICKILRFVNYLNSACSAFLLLVIAIDRYKKICRPLKPQISEKKAIVIGFIVMGIATVVAIPSPILYGRSSVKTEYPGITGTACFTEDRFKNTKYQALYNGVLILVVLVILVSMICLYSLVGRKIWRQAKSRSKSQLSTKKTVVSVDSPTNTNSADSTGTQSSNLTSTSSSLTVNSNDKLSSTEATEMKTLAVKNEAGKEKKKDSKLSRMSQTKRITLMLFIITVVYILAFLPHLGLKLTVFLNKKFLSTLSPTGLFLYHTFVWSFFINNMANPIIYGFCDSRFREYVRDMYTCCTKTTYKVNAI